MKIINIHEMLIKESRSGNTKNVKKLIKEGANVNYKYMNNDYYDVQEQHYHDDHRFVFDYNNQSPLLYASFEGFIDIVKLLIKAGINVNTCNTDNFSSLHYACDFTPVDYTSLNNHIKIVKLLIKNGANVNITNKHRQIPLHNTSIHGFTDIVKLLIKANTDIDILDYYGNTPLHYASIYGHTEIVKLLIKAHANVNVFNSGYSILFYKFSKSMFDNSDKTILYYALINNSQNIIKILLNKIMY